MSKRYVVITLVILTTITILAASAASGIGDGAEGSSLTATPTAELPPERDNASASETVVPPGSVPPAWVMQGPVRTNAVLHWAESSSVTGQPTTVSDIWVELDKDGVIKRLHAFSTESDGTFYQENGYSKGTAYTVWSAGTHPLHPDAACVDAGNSPPPPAPLGPPFVADTASLESFGLVQAPAAVATAPTTEQPEGLAPRQAFSADQPWITWELQSTLPDGRSQDTLLSVGPAQRVIHEHSVDIAADGVITQQRDIAYGRLDIYDPGTVPGSVFAKISAVEEPCYVPH